MKARHTLKPVYVCVLLALSAQAVLANPLNPTVVNGQASFATTGNALTVTNTPGTIINWQGFSIGAREITRFNQQSAASAVLNRVISNNPSSILGALQSNGRVFLVNPNGIVFGAGATVDVAGLVASSLNLSNADFLAGRYNFTQVPGAANISNAGNITAHDGGQIFLIAAKVENTGVITAPNGEILLAAGHSVDLVNTTNPNLRVNITAPAGDATNVGQLIASAGSLGLFGTIVRNSGQVSADSATMQGGKIVFKASQRVEAGGVMSAQGAGGGNIAVLADMQAGIVNVTGTLDASAPNSGNGGFIETSATHVQIANTAAVSTFSRNGTSGTWLIDPTDYTVSAIDPGGGSWMSNSTLATSLGSGSVIIQTLASGTGNGDIFVSDAVSWAGASSLTLNAIRNVNIDAAISNSDKGNLIVRADLNGTSTGTVNFGESGMVALSGGGRADLYYNPEAYDIPTTYTGYMSATPFTAWMLVNDVNQLQAMDTNLTGKYALGANIDATATSGWNEGAGFVPVGSSDGSFAGQFDGLNHTISNLFINMPSTNYAGLFGYMRGGSALRNVGLVGGSVSGSVYVGGLAGKNYGSISNAYATGSVNGTNYVGGLVGFNAGTVGNAYATGSVTGISNNVGGLAGYNDYSGDTIINSYATGSVRRDGSFGGGLVGLNNGTVSNSFWDAQTSDQTSSGAGTGMTTAQMQQQANFTSSTPANGNVNPDWDFAGTWVMYDGHTYPLLRSFMTKLTVTANNDTKTYDGQAYSGGNGVSYSSPPNANLLGTLSYVGTSQGAINSGNYVITPGGLYSNQQGYILSYVDGALTVNPAPAPATTPVVPQPVISSLVSMSIPAINIPFNPPVPPVLMQAPTIDEINLLGPTAAGSDNPDDEAARDAAAAGTASVTVAEAAPLPVCR
ncbi:MAG: filamentous hemagglutinin N-terminal domain-containing protein [Rugosibacter sp.]|nr:filamentous hemagglutinin N-terminal domain-containing protein [Rugosibacter sp.]